MKTKVCTKCGEEKELTEFYKKKGGKFGVTSSCKICDKADQAAYRKTNSEKIKARKAAYRKANPEKIKAKNSAYYKANPEKVKASQAEYRKANPEKTKAYLAAYRAYRKEMRELQEEAGFEISDLNQGDQC